MDFSECGCGRPVLRGLGLGLGLAGVGHERSAQSLPVTLQSVESMTHVE